MTKDTLRAVVENVLLGLIAAWLGFTVPWWLVFRILFRGSQEPQGIGLVGLLVILVGFVGAGMIPSMAYFKLHGAHHCRPCFTRMAAGSRAPWWRSWEQVSRRWRDGWWPAPGPKTRRPPPSDASSTGSD